MVVGHRLPVLLRALQRLRLDDADCALIATLARMVRPEDATQHPGRETRGKPWRTADAYRPADLVKRDFTASGPDRLSFADFTHLRCWEGVVYFTFVIDAHSRAISTRDDSVPKQAPQSK